MSGNLPGESDARIIQIPAIVFCVVAPATVGIRFWSRIRVSNTLGADDWTILASLIFSLAVSILMLESCAYGFGQHISNLTPYNKKMALKLFVVAQAFYKISINLTKCSILLLYLRIFVQKMFRVVCWILLAIILCYGVASTLAAIFQCTPVARAWDKSLPGTCINITMNWYANAGFSIATDVIILLLPMPIIHSLRLQMNQKIGLMFIFGLGAFVVVTSSLRMTTIDFSSTSPDTTYNIASSMWTIVESNIGIICACLPCCRPILHLLFPSIFPSNDPNSSNIRGRGRGYSSGSYHNNSTTGGGGNSFSGNGKFTKASSGKDKDVWIPPTALSQDMQLSSVRASHNESAERILREQRQEHAYEKIMSQEKIHKATDSTVKYHEVVDT